MIVQTDVLINKIHKQIAIWLFICCFTIFTIVILGGATRLTGSGLSIAKLHLFRGVIPPMSQGDWEKAFNEYKLTAEYKITYKEKMNIDTFKSIFWLEYIHRFVGRFLAAFIFFIPFLYFLIRYFFIKKIISRSLIIKLLLMFALGGLQALLGWLMVKSGLDTKTAHIQGENVHVSPYRLVLHLVFAFIIYAYILWVALQLYFPKPNNVLGVNFKGLRRFGYLVTAWIFITVISGGFVAGIRGGLVYQTFPLMHGFFIPPDLFNPQIEGSVLNNFFLNQTTVQFDHRILAILLFFVTLTFWISSFKYKLSNKSKILFHSILIIIITQITFGILTLLNFVPKSLLTITLATIHQGIALILFTISIIINFKLRQLKDM